MKYEPIYLQKAVKYEPDKDSKLLAGRWLSEKLDGVGCQAVFNNGIVRLYAMSKAKKSGVFSEFTNKLPHIVDELEDIEFDDGIIQGEIITDYVPEGGERVGYITGILHADDGVKRQEEHKLKFVAYEMPSHKGTYTERYACLKYIFDSAPLMVYASLNPILGINDAGNTMLEKHFDKIIAAGGEGCVLYDPTCRYKHSTTTCARNKGLIKIKAENETEVLCVEMIEGDGKHQGTLGAMECIDNMGNQFHIGSFKITDEERDRIWNIMEAPFVVEMLYFMKTPTSYKLPRFKRVRYDKSISDWNKVD